MEAMDFDSRSFRTLKAAIGESGEPIGKPDLSSQEVS